MTSAWQPLLSGEAAVRARASSEAIGAALARLEDVALLQAEGSSPRAGQRAASLASGWAGIALLHAYRARASGSASAHDDARAALARALAIVARVTSTPDLYGGFTGVAWVLEHLRGDHAADSYIDSLLLDVVQWPRIPGGYDLASGLVGFGVYALERLPRDEAVVLLERVIARVAREAERGPAGARWLTPPVHLHASHRALAPQGYYNMGVAHGVPGIIALLAAAMTAGVAQETAAALLDDAVRWLLSQRLPRGSTVFPYWIPRGEGEAKPARLAWCYGDAGVATALWQASRAARRREWEQAALELAVDAAALAPEHAKVVDTSLCHGSAGLAHLFNRLYQASGEERLAEAARRWYGHALAWSSAGRDVANLPLDAAQHPTDALADVSFLTGAAGVGLALVGACTDVAPDWDRVLLAAVPPAPRAFAAPTAASSLGPTHLLS